MKSITALVCSFSLFSAVSAVDISNLNRCVDDVKLAIAHQDQSVNFFTQDYQQLMSTLNSIEIKDAFPPVYQSSMFDPFVSYLERLGDWGFSSIFSYPGNDPQQGFFQQIIPDVAEAFLQATDIQIRKATNAFQELVSDLYDGFLSEESRTSNQTGRPIKPPDRGILAPLVKWGNPDAGPYTWPADATSALNLKAAIVSLPPAHIGGGLLAWATIPHETGGHDLLHADNGLLEELGNKAYAGVIAQFPGDAFLANYWKLCIDETASDVVGLLNAGPAAGISLVGYFRGLLGSGLRNTGSLPPADTHPVDILRGFIAAHVVENLSFSGAKEWGSAIRQEVKKDLQTIYLVDSQKGLYYKIPQQKAIRSAEIVADIIMNSSLTSLEGHSLREIQDWTDDDQRISDELGSLLKSGRPLPSTYQNSGYFATHVLSGAVQEALKSGADVGMIFNRMVDFLDVMHQYNQTWNEPSSVQCHCDCSCDCCAKCRIGEALFLPSPRPTRVKSIN